MMRPPPLLALFLAGICGIVMAAAVWFTWRPHYTAICLIRIAATPPSLVFPTERGATDFDTYKNTQQQYLKTTFVLTAALRNVEASASRVKEIPTTRTTEISAARNEENFGTRNAERFATRDRELVHLTDFTCFGKHDPVDWLTGNLQVSFPGNAELMSVSLRGENPEEMTHLVNAVLDAYMGEVVQAEEQQRRRRLDQLEKICSEKVMDLRCKRRQFAELAKSIPGSEPELLNGSLQLALQQTAAVRAQLLYAQTELMRLRRDLKARQQSREDVPGAEIEALIQKDTTSVQLRQELTALRERLEKKSGGPSSDGRANQARRDETAEAEIVKALAVRQQELRQQLREEKQLVAEIAAAVEQERQLLAMVTEAEREVTRFPRPAIDLELLRTEIAQTEGILKTVNDQRERLRIELGAPPRVTATHKAEVPATPDADFRWGFTLLAGLAGFLLPVGWATIRSARNRSVEGLDVEAPGIPTCDDDKSDDGDEDLEEDFLPGSEEGEQVPPCPECGGKGTAGWGDPCPLCGGSGLAVDG